MTALEQAVAAVQRALTTAGIRQSPLVGNALLVEAVFLLARTGVPREKVDEIYDQISDGAYSAANQKSPLYGPDGRLV